MTRVLYMEERRGQDPDPNYLREFDARITERGPDHVILDRTIFYAEGGGQPWDTGVLRWAGGEAKVHKVTKEKGVIRHFVDAMPPQDEVHGVVDWDRRYAHMRFHTSQHLMSGIVWTIFGARTVGNQLHADRARVDFQPVNFLPADLKRIEDACNQAISEALPVRIYEEDRVKIENEIGDRSLVDLIPKHITRLRVIRVGDRDYCPCGGTHLKNTAEIGRIRITERKSKGKETDRITYVIDG
jgi:misacylated tRNA(Ala) deacylase